MDDLREPKFGPPEIIWRKPEPKSLFSDGAAQLAAAFRLPLFAPAQTGQQSEFRGFERGNRVEVSVRTRNGKVGRAMVEDAHILAYVVTTTIRLYDKRFVFLGWVPIEPAKMLQKMGLPAGPADVEKTIDSMRRIHMTKVAVTNWGPKRITASQPLLSIELYDGKFFAQTPDWMEDEIITGRVARIRRDDFAYRGARAVLFGWARTFVGLNTGDARVIVKPEAIMRAGPFGDGIDPWTELTKAVAINDIPGFEFSLTTRDDWPAIKIKKLWVHTCQEISSVDQINVLEWLPDDDEKRIAL